MQGPAFGFGLVHWYCPAASICGTVPPLSLFSLAISIWVVWARFVLISSLLMCFRFGTLLTRFYRHKPVE